MQDFDAYLTADDVRFDAADARLLEAVDEHGSLNAAADALGRSYARANRRVTDLETAFGTLVDRQRGGEGGGGSTLTDAARDLLARFDRLRTGFEGVAAAAETVFAGDVVTRHGELATVDTEAGRVRAIVPTEAERVELTLRSDAVTLHAPDDAPPVDGTSARNRVRGTVRRLERGEAVVHVSLEVGTDEPLVALVTTESADRLGLEPGRAVVASFKATATRATAR